MDTRVFQPVHHTRTHTQTTTTNTQHNTQHHTETETERDRARRQTERERARRQRERREDEREEDKREREKMKEKPNIFLLNRVKYDSSLISFSASWQANIFFKKKKNSSNCLIHAVTVFIFLIYLLMQLQFRFFRII